MEKVEKVNKGEQSGAIDAETRAGGPDEEEEPERKSSGFGFSGLESRHTRSSVAMSEMYLSRMFPNCKSQDRKSNYTFLLSCARFRASGLVMQLSSDLFGSFARTRNKGTGR